MELLLYSLIALLPIATVFLLLVAYPLLLCWNSVRWSLGGQHHLCI